MCNLSPNIFSIHSVDLRLNDHKYFITPRKKEGRHFKKRYFVSSLSIWYNVLSPKINNTPYPNKCKTLKSASFFWVNQKVLFSPIQNEQNTSWDWVTSRPSSSDLDFHKCRISFINKVQVPEYLKTETFCIHFHGKLTNWPDLNI